MDKPIGQQLAEMALKHHDNMEKGLRQVIAAGMLPNEDPNILAGVLKRFEEIRPAIAKQAGEDEKEN